MSRLVFSLAIGVLNLTAGAALYAQPEPRGRDYDGVPPRAIRPIDDRGPRLRPADDAGDRRHSHDSPAWKIGVEGEDLDVGVRLTHVYVPSPASRAGLEVDDIVVNVGGVQVGNIDGQAYDIAEEFQRRADARGYVALLVWNHRERTLAQRTVRLERNLEPSRPSRVGKVTGLLTSRDRLDIPRGAVVEVRLVEVTRDNARRNVLADVNLENVASLPANFELDFDRNDLDPNAEYAVESYVLMRGRPRYQSSRPALAIRQGNVARTVEVALEPARAINAFDRPFSLETSDGRFAPPPR